MNILTHIHQQVILPDLVSGSYLLYLLGYNWMCGSLSVSRSVFSPKCHFNHNRGKWWNGKWCEYNSNKS